MKQKNQNGRLKKQWGQITDGLPEFKNLTSYLYSDKVNRNVLYHMVPYEPMMEPISGDSAFILLILQPSFVGGHTTSAAQQAIL